MKDVSKETAIELLLKKFPDTRIHDAIRAFLSDLLDRLPSGLTQYLVNRDGASQFPQILRRHFKPADIIEPNGCQRTWELIGL
jgi:hypothetical protein